MKLEVLAGTWLFKHETSQMQMPPQKWMQHIRIENGCVVIFEEITRACQMSTVTVSAVPDGTF